MEKMINKWLSAGMITQEIASVLLDDVKKEKARQYRIRLNICIYTVATVLIGIGIIAFIAANDWLLAILTALPVLQILLMLFLAISAQFFGNK